MPSISIKDCKFNTHRTIIMKAWSQINSEEEKYTKVEERGRGWNLGYYGILVRGKGDGRKDKYEGREGRWAEGNWQIV